MSKLKVYEISSQKAGAKLLLYATPPIDRSPIWTAISVDVGIALIARIAPLPVASGRLVSP